jgi:hypothetical protein
VLRRLFEYGRSEQWLADRYPEHRRPRWNAVTALGLVTAAGLAVRGRRGIAVLPVAAAAVLAAEAWQQCPPGRRGGAVLAAAAARRLVEWSFDAGAVVAALQLGRPPLLFMGFVSPRPGSSGAH